MDRSGNKKNKEIVKIDSKSLLTKLSSISLEKEEISDIRRNQSIKIIRDEVLGLFPAGKLVNKIINWNEEINKDIENRKKEILLESYFEKLSNEANTIDTFKKFIENLHGNMIFNKLLKTLENHIPDEELTGHLSNVLINIVNSDFVRQFESHRFILSRIETISPQGLTMMIRFRDQFNFKMIKGSGPFSIGAEDVINNDGWTKSAAMEYAEEKGIIDEEVINRLDNTIKTLLFGGLLNGFSNKSPNREGVIKLTPVAKEIVEYLV